MSRRSRVTEISQIKLPNCFFAIANGCKLNPLMVYDGNVIDAIVDYPPTHDCDLAGSHGLKAGHVTVEAVSITTIRVSVGVLPEGGIRPACKTNDVSCSYSCVCKVKATHHRVRLPLSSPTQPYLAGRGPQTRCCYPCSPPTTMARCR